jgi:hypothetical protein
MVQLIVTCPECGLRGELSDTGKEFNNPAGKCKQVLNPARCPSLRIPVLGARRMLEHLEWDAFLAADGEIRMPAAPVQSPTGPDEVFPTLPLVAQDSEAIRLAAIDAPDAVIGEAHVAATDGEL